MHNNLLLGLGAALLMAPTTLAQPNGFPTRSGIVTQMSNAAASFPAICKLVDLNTTYGTPKTHQGRSQYAVKISDNVNSEEDEPAFLMVAAHHGNEYGTPIVALDTIARLTEGYANDPAIKALVDNYEIWIAPCWNIDGYYTSRNNRRPGGSVDLNRNYPFLWNSPCNTGTKGPSAGSEPETQTMIALSEDQRFTKVLDFHSSGRETLWGYRSGCGQHVLGAYLQAEAVALSQASSYNGKNRGPSSNGEHYQWQLGNYSNYAFLTEISSTQSPSITSAKAEAARLWPGTVWMLQRPIPVAGHVTDATSGLPIEAQISYVENPFTQGEQNRSEPQFGRYHAFLPNGSHTIRFSHPCYVTKDVAVSVTSAGVTMNVQMTRIAGFATAAATSRNGSSVNPLCLTSNNRPVFGTEWQLEVDPNGIAGASSVAFVATTLPGNGPVLGGLGEVLIDPLSPLLFAISAPTAGSPTELVLPIPLDLSAMGFSASVQGVVVTGATTATLCNAIDFTIGCN